MANKFDKSVSLVCWAYNEELLIKDFLIRAAKLMDETVSDFEIVIVDDCSTDKTNELIKEVQKDYPQIRLLRNEKNLNVGLSSARAIQSASKEYLFWQTVDWSYDIRHLREFLELLKSYDIVAGVRRKPVHSDQFIVKAILLITSIFGMKHLTRRSDTVSKAFVSLFNYLLIRFLFRVPLSDYQNVVFYKTKYIQSVNQEAKSSFANPEYLLKAYWAGKSIVEVPINFLKRDLGEAKGTRFSAIVSSITDIFRLWFKWIVFRGIKNRSKGSIQRLYSQKIGKNKVHPVPFLANYPASNNEDMPQP